MSLRLILMTLALPALGLAKEPSPTTPPTKPYGLTDLFKKAVDNQGVGQTETAPYGVRNLRVVLDGLVYRGGANNFFPNRPGDVKRDNHNPLKTRALETLCEDNFDTAIYLYDKNFKSAPRETKCSGDRSIQYMSLPPLSQDKNVSKILGIIHERLTDTSVNKKKIYLHCWNGWHASGFISALALRQFCDLSAEAAVSYWDKNTDGNNKSKVFNKVRESIRKFKPDPKLKISEDQKKKFCL